MKTLFALFLLAGVTTARAQGVVTFANNVLIESGGPDVLVRSLDGSPLAGTNYLAQLYWSTDGGDSFTSITAAPSRFKPPTAAPPFGVWLGGNRTLPEGVGGPGVTLQMQVKVWDVLAGATFDEVRAVGGLWGESAVFSYTQQMEFPPYPPGPYTYMVNFRGFSLIPEPSVTFLGVCGLVFWGLTRAILIRLQKHSSSRPSK